MVYALDQFPGGLVFSRAAKSSRAKCIDVQFAGWRKLCFRAIARIPLVRSRRDILTLLDDTDFDSQVAAIATSAALFDGVMGQCCLSFEQLSPRGIPLVLTALNMHIDALAEALTDEHKRLQISLPTFIHPRMRQRIHREIELATYVRAVSEASKQSLIDRGVPADKIEVILPAVDLDHFRPAPQKDDVFRVLAVCTIDARKGAYYLLQAFEKAAIPNSELVIIGATGDSWARQMLAGFTSRLSNIRIQSADVLKEPVEATYGQASVFVHPAIEDGFALAVGQALACGKPVIATRQTGASQLISEGENGYVLECRDVDGLVDRLRLLSHDHALRTRLSNMAPAAVAKLGYPSFASNVARLYRRLLNN